jgi:hypothetical protein
MHTPRDISDMPEGEVPWEYRVNAPERRKAPREACPDALCINLIVTENRLTQLANDFYSYKRATNDEMSEASTERKEIISKLDKIDSHLDKQRGFFAGTVWIGGAVAGIIGLVISYFKS